MECTMEHLMGDRKIWRQAQTHTGPMVSSADDRIVESNVNTFVTQRIWISVGFSTQQGAQEEI